MVDVAVDHVTSGKFTAAALRVWNRLVRVLFRLRKVLLLIMIRAMRMVMSRLMIRMLLALSSLMSRVLLLLDVLIRLHVNRRCKVRLVLLRT